MDSIYKKVAEMNFKEWLGLQEINKGLERNFLAQHPHLPPYVARQALHNRVAPIWNNVWAGQAPTVAPVAPKINVQQSNEKIHPQPGGEVMDKNDVFTKPKTGDETMASPTGPRFNPKFPVYNTPSQAYGHDFVNRIAGYKNWKEEVVSISPLNFTQNTIQNFLRHEFGSSPSMQNRVKAHDERMAVQSQLAQERGQGNNEPIILTRQGDKFEMEEGWHRLYSHLLQFSAPPEERQKVLSGQVADLDLSKWRPIKIKAWIGS
jgi:hypothetical protein